MKTWESLFRNALAVLDNAVKAGMPDDWSFGGGTVLMLKYHHRFSKDVDIFVTDPQCLGFLSPRLNEGTEMGTNDYDEQTNSLKLYYGQGEVDFVVAMPLTPAPFETLEIMGRMVKVETPLEIVAKKIQFRATDFKARDLFDLALVLERESAAIPTLARLIQNKKDVLLKRFRSRDAVLREDFQALDVLNFNPSYNACLKLVESVGGILLH